MAGLKIGGLNRTLKTLARPVRTPGGWGLRNPEHEPDRAVRQQWLMSQVSLACAWRKWGRIMIRLTKP